MKNLRNGLREKIYENKIAKKCLALLLALSMTAGFVMPYEDVFESAFTASAEEELVCGKEEHIHSEGCYQLICTENQEIQPETETAETDETTETSETAETAEADVEEHIHDENCYELACTLEEHVHDELCYAAEENNEQEEEPDEETGDFSFFDVFPETIAIMQSEFPPSKKPDVDTSGDPKPNQNKQYFESPAYSVGKDSYEIKESNITYISVTISGTKYESDGKKTEATVKIDGDKESVDASFTLAYHISKEEHDISTDNPCIYYQLPEGVVVPTEYYGWTRFVSDPNYTSPSNNNTAGYFSINKDGLIVIQFTDDYIEKVISKSESFAGSLMFEGTLNRANSQSGDRTVDMGDLSLKLDFSDKNSTVAKSYATPEYSNDGVKITWTVTVTNVANPADIGGYILKDSQPEFFNASNVTVSPSNVGKFNENGEFVFNNNANIASEITFTYTQFISEEDYVDIMQASPSWGDEGEFVLTSNKAELRNGDEIISQSSQDVKAKKPTIRKSGEPSYQNGKFIDDVIYWTIDVTAPDRSNLNGYFVEDDAFTKDGGLVTCTNGSVISTDKNDKDENGHRKGIVITDSSGRELVEGEGKDYKINGNRIEFLGDFTSVTIEYATNTKATNGIVKNKAKIIYSNEKDGPEKETDVQYTGSRYNLNNKTGSYDYDTGIFTWTIGADIPNKSNTKNYLNGYLTLYDAALEYVDLEDITVTANWNNVVTEFQTKVEKRDNKDVIVICSKDGAEYGILEKVYDEEGLFKGLKLDGGSENTSNSDNSRFLHSISLTYEIDIRTIDDDNKKGLEITDDGTTKKYKNTVSDGYNKPSSAEIGVTERSEIDKSVSADAPDISYWDKEDDDKELHWTVELTEDAGFEKGSIFTDTLTSSSDDVGHNVGHYFDYSKGRDVSISNAINLKIVLRPKQGESKTLVEGTDFEAKIEGNKLTITFSDDFTAYTYATITYTSKAKISEIGRDGDDWEAMHATFKNNAYYKKGKSASYTYTSENPEYIKRFTLSLNKKWSDSNDLTGRPDYIYVRLQRKLSSEDDNGWKYIYPDEDGEWKVVELENEKDIDDHTFAVSRSSGYYQYWTNLPKDTAKNHDDNYQYRIRELDVEGYSADYPNDYVSYSSQSSGQTFTIDNIKSNNIKKYVLDKNGSIVENGRLSLDNIDLVDADKIKSGDKQISGQYYVIGYEIEVNIVDKTDQDVIDTLPAGWMLLYDSSSTSYEYQPYYFSNIIGDYPVTYSGKGNEDYWTFDVTSITDNTTNNKYEQVNFYSLKNVRLIKYYMAIEKTELDKMIEEKGVVSVSNTANIKGDIKKITADVVVSKEKTEYENPSLITKDVYMDGPEENGKYNVEGAKITYRILVNPNAQKLAPINKSTYDITDILDMPPGVKADIYSVTAREVMLNPPDATPGDDGKYSFSDVVDVNQKEDVIYSYVPGDNSVTETDISDKFVFPPARNIIIPNSSSTVPDAYKTDSKTILKEGTTFKFTIKGTYTSPYGNYEDYQLLLYKYYSDENTAGGGISANRITKLDGKKFEVVQTYTVTEDDVKGSAKLCDFAFQANAVLDIESIEVEAVEKKVHNSGELIITVPDSKALLIEYTYILSKEGGFAIKDDTGRIISDTSTVTITNEASINTGNVSSWDKEDNTEFEVADARANVRATHKFIKLLKRDINDYSLKIGADFYIAYYKPDTKEWVFCDSISTENQSVNDVSTDYYKLEFGSTAVTKGNEIPEGAVAVEVDSNLGGCNINFPENLDGYIFKVIEVPTEPGYEGTNIGSYEEFKAWLSSYLKDGNLPDGVAESYRVFFEKYNAVHYFAYFNTELGESGKDKDINYNNAPSGIDYGKIAQVGNFEELTVYNNKLLNIAVDKQWNGGNFEDKYAVRMMLYYSKNQAMNGASFPDAMELADADILGITDSSFTALVELSQGQPSYTWKNLPTSLNGDRIYYYVREEMYTTDGTKWYTLQSDGTYRSNDGEKGSFHPNYNGNGISRAEQGKDTANVVVNNVSGLYFKKIWLNYYHGEMSSNLDELPDILKVKISGTLTSYQTVEELRILQDDKEITEKGWLDLMKSDSYMFEVTSDMTFVDAENNQYTAKDFLRLYITDEKAFDLGEDKEKKALSEDGEETDKLYLEDYTKSDGTSGVTNGNGIISIVNQQNSPLPIAVTAEKIWGGSENPPDGTEIKLTLYRTTDPSITSENFKEYIEDTTKMQQVGDEITLPDEGKWYYTWKDLAQKFIDEENETAADYIYFVVEETGDLTGYKPPAYTNQGIIGGGTITVINTPVPKAQLEVIKRWSDPNATDRPGSITVDLYRKLKDQPTAQTVSLKARGYRLSTAMANYNVDYEETGTLEFGSMTQDGVAILADTYPYTTETDNVTGETYYLYDNANNQYGWSNYPCKTIKLPADISDGTRIKKVVVNISDSTGALGFFVGVDEHSPNWNDWEYSNGLRDGNDKIKEYFDFGERLSSVNAGEYTFNCNVEYNPNRPYFNFAFTTDVYTGKIDSIKIYVSLPFSATIKTDDTTDTTNQKSSDIYVGNEATITANEAITGFTIGKGKEAVNCELNEEAGTITVTGKKPGGNAEITVTNSNGDSDTVNITVHGIKISPDNDTILENDKKEGSVTFTVSQSNANDQLPKITRDGKEVDVDVSKTNKKGEFEVTISYPEDLKGKEILTGVAIEYLVYYNNEDNSEIFTLNINPQILTAEISQDSVNVGKTFTVKLNKKADKWELDPSLSLNTSPEQDENGYWIYTITAIGEKDVEGAKIIVWNPDGDENDKQERSINIKMVYEEENVTTNDKDYVMTITLVPKDDGSGTYAVADDDEARTLLAKLPVTDDDGNTYIYYIRERTDGEQDVYDKYIDLKGYVPWKYVNNFSELKGTTTMYIYNGKEKSESEGADLPSVGGIGTRPYTAAGFAIMSASAAIMLIKRRKRRSL